jgi:signal peptidase I
VFALYRQKADKRNIQAPFSSAMIVSWLVTAMLCLITLLLAFFMVGMALGYRVLIIRSGSMVPTLHVGDLVIDRSIAPSQAAPGEVVTFRDPRLNDQLVTHRIVSMHWSGNQVMFVTRGDANHANETWSISKTGTIGQAVAVDPIIGHLIVRLTSRIAEILEIAFCALWLGYLLIGWIWRGSPAPASRYSGA